VSAGYSGTPLARKLGLKDGMRVQFLAMPATVRQAVDTAAPPYVEARVPPYELVHVFSRQAADLAALVAQARNEIAPDGMIWVSWPKKASKVPTDITEDTIRRIALPMGLVDIKVCAVDAIWSGLKLVIRKELREPSRG
jgi:hypothetical protein